MPTFEYVRDERGFEVLIDTSDSTPHDVQEPDDIQPFEPDVLGSGSSLVNEVVLFANTTGNFLKQSSVIISSLNMTGLHKITLGDISSIGQFCLFTGDNNLITFSAPNIGGTQTYILPIADGASGNSLTTDGSGILSWSSSSGGVQNPMIIDLDGGNFKINNILAINLSADPLLNTFYGFQNHVFLSTGTNNIAIGDSVLPSITTGTSNIAIGNNSLNVLDMGERNISIGTNSGETIIGGNDNVIIGFEAANGLLTNNSNNILIGAPGVVSDNNTIRLGKTNHSQLYITGSYQKPTNITSTEIVVQDSTHLIGTKIETPCSSGVTSGGVLSINVGNSDLFDISDGFGFIYSLNNRFAHRVNWSGLIGINIPKLGTSDHIYITFAGVVQSQADSPTEEQGRSNIHLGVIIRPGGNTIVLVVPSIVLTAFQSNQFKNFTRAIGPINLEGMIIGSNNLLTIQRSSGRCWKYISNFVLNELDPHIVNISLLDTNVGGTFRLFYQDNSVRNAQTSIIPAEYDDGNGESLPGAVSNNQWQTFRFFTASDDSLDVQPGQILYGSLATAVAAIGTENFVQASNLQLATLTGFLTCKGNETDLSSLNSQFVKASKFGSVGSAGGSGGDIFSDSSSVNLNALCRFADTSGKLIQESPIVDTAGTLTNLTGLFSSGAIDFTCNRLTVVASNNNPAAILLRCDGLTSSQICIENTTGTDQQSIDIFSTLGGIRINQSLGLDITGGRTRIDSPLEIRNNSQQISFSVNAAQATTYDIELPINVPTTNLNTVLTNKNNVCNWSVNAPLPKGYIEGFQLSYATASTVNVAAGRCRSGDDTFDLILGAGTVDINASGTAGGLDDLFVEGNDIWYSINVVGDTTGITATNYLIIPHISIQNQPEYDVIRRIGLVYNNSSSNFRPFNQVLSEGRDRTYYWDDEIANLTALSLGTSAIYADVNLSTFVPRNEREVILQTTHTNGATSDAFASFKNKDSSITNSPFRTFGMSNSGSIVTGSSHHNIQCDANNLIQYKNENGGTTDIFCLGFIDSILFEREV